MRLVSRLRPILEAHRRTLASAIPVLLLINALVWVSHVAATRGASELSIEEGYANGSADDGSGAGEQSALPSAGTSLRPGALPGTIGSSLPGITQPRPGSGSGRVPPGIDFRKKEIHVLYYWKGDRTMTSPYLRGSGQEGNVDEGEAFRTLVDYLNKYNNGGRTFMGYPFNFKGWKIRGQVIDVGTDSTSYGENAKYVAEEIRPFAAVSSHGSLSAYSCEHLAKGGVHNFSTYDLGDGSGKTMLARSNGYCFPAQMSWERQVAVTESYLRWHKTTQYVGPELRYQTNTPCTSGCPRRYGMLWVRYPGLEDSAPKAMERLKRAGIPVVAFGTLNESLSTSQLEVPGIVQQFRAAYVNTLIIPDAGAPLNFTHSAQANGYSPDYYVWPCSGQDSSGMVRLYDANQWSRARGLSCYDDTFDADLTNDGVSEQTEWYRMYKEMKPRDEPPAPTAIVMNGLLPLVVGLTNLQGDFTVENFRAGIDRFVPYRYHGFFGRKGVSDPQNLDNILVTVNATHGSIWADVARVYWDSDETKEDSKTPGQYIYENGGRRYGPGAAFSGS